MKAVMKSLLLTWAVVVLGALSGCGGTEHIRVVEKNTYVVVSPEAFYLDDCEKSPPPSKEAYQKFSMDEREDALTRTQLNQYKKVSSCTLDKRLIRAVVEKSKASVEEMNKKEEVRIQKLLKGEHDG